MKRSYLLHQEDDIIKEIATWWNTVAWKLQELTLKFLYEIMYQVDIDIFVRDYVSSDMCYYLMNHFDIHVYLMT